MKNVTQEELDWLVEGEMSRGERDEIFARLDRQTEGWKRLALALLEQRALETALGGPVGSASESALPAGEKITGVSSPGPRSRMPWPARIPATFAGPARSWIGLAVAASMLGLCFLFGTWWAAGNSSPLAKTPDPSTPDTVPAHPVLASLVRQDPGIMLAVNQAVHRVSVKDRELIALVAVATAGDKQLILPVIESRVLSQKFADQPVSANWPSRLVKSGWSLSPHREFLSLHLPDGTNEVLPVNLVSCRYVGKPVF